MKVIKIGYPILVILVLFSAAGILSASTHEKDYLGLHIQGLIDAEKKALGISEGVLGTVQSEYIGNRGICTDFSCFMLNITEYYSNGNSLITS